VLVFNSVCGQKVKGPTALIFWFTVFFSTVTGCSDYVAPPGAVATRTRDRVAVQCRSGALHWELRCELGRWVGRTYNCSDAEWTQAWTIGRLLNSSATFSRRTQIHRLPARTARLRPKCKIIPLSFLSGGSEVDPATMLSGK